MTIGECSQDSHPGTLIVRPMGNKWQYSWRVHDVSIRCGCATMGSRLFDTAEEAWQAACAQFGLNIPFPGEEFLEASTASEG
jgi:hypothetical protein